MRRRITTIATALSFLLFVAVVALWVRSHWADDFVWYGQIGAHIDRFGAITEPGTIRFFADHEKDAPRGNDRFYHSNWPATGSHWGGESYMQVYWDRFGFSFITDRYGGFLRGWDFAIPHWLFAFVFAVLPIRWLVSRLRKRRSAGRCTGCGYDLRASPSRCPECGLEVKAGVPAAA